MKGRRGREVALHTFQAAALALELVARHRVKPLKLAVTVALESVKHHLNASVTQDAVERLCRKLRKHDALLTARSDEKFQLAFVSDGFVDDAMGRLTEAGRKNCGWAMRAAEPPFVIAVARLFDKIDIPEE